MKKRGIGKGLQKMGFRLEWLLLLTLVLTILLCTLASGAQSGKMADIYYESVRIESGDTLWSIALQYKPENEKTEHMVDKIMYCNQMKTTNIRAGENIIVPIRRAQ